MTSVTPRLPEFLFDAWQLRSDDISRAQERDELHSWTVSSLCSAYLKYQLDRHERELEANTSQSAPSLTSASVNSIIEQLHVSSSLEEEVSYIAESLSDVTLRHVLHDPRTPYVVFRAFDALLSLEGSRGIRKLIDIDEAILASEQYIRLQKRTDYLVRLEDLRSILGPPNQHGIASFKRKTPPKGGFEFLDQKKKQTMQILGTDARWLETFHQATEGCLYGMNWENVFIAGGVVLNTLLFTSRWDDNPRDMAHKQLEECDIDLYLYGLTPEEANRKVDHIYETWYKNTNGEQRSHQAEHQLIIKTAKTITFMPVYPVRRIQIILKIMPSPLDILLNFDLDACALGFNGSQVLMLPRCARAIETGYSTFTMDLIWGHHLGNRRESQEVRIFKYADRGFGLRILPSYIKSLETPCSEDIEHNCQDDRSGPTRIFEREPGLKTIRRIAYLAQAFVQRRYSGEQSMPLISLAALDGYAMHDGLPDHRKGLAMFEVLMRHCEAWRMDVTGSALYVYSTYLGIAEKLHISPRDGRYVDYLTRRIRRIVADRDLEAVRKLQITMPLIIPLDLEVSITNEAISRCAGSPGVVADHLPQLIPVHNPQKHDPRTTMLPSLADTVCDSGNYRYWLITNENMWAGQHRVADEISDLLTTLFDWFLHCERQPGNGPIRRGADNYNCIWHLAKGLRRRLVLPEESDERDKGISKREARLFRPWALTRPPRVQKSYDANSEMETLEDQMEAEDHISDSAFWDDEEKGSWGDEEGVPAWTD
ncbi:MAG: hypothetical protein Q9209_007518 [Squamulea sp. 1 TL-2023]